MNIIEITTKHAIEAHKAVNHLYDGKPYETHLTLAVMAGLFFKHLLPHEDVDNVIAGIWEHDTIEDCNLTYNDVKNATNETVAELAYACTNEKGRNRAERANAKYYEGIRNTKHATFVKLCDRIANIQYSLSVNNRMIDVYKKEHKHFKEMLYTDEYKIMWDFIDELFEG